MYTVEFEEEDTVITVLCEEDDQEDVEVIIGHDGTTFIRQLQAQSDYNFVLYYASQKT